MFSEKVEIRYVLNSFNYTKYKNGRLFLILSICKNKAEVHLTDCSDCSCTSGTYLSTAGTSSLHQITLGDQRITVECVFKIDGSAHTVSGFIFL